MHYVHKHGGEQWHFLNTQQVSKVHSTPCGRSAGHRIRRGAPWQGVSITMKFRRIIFFCLLALFCSDSGAVWSKFAHVTPETADEYGIEVTIKRVSSKSQRFRVYVSKGSKHQVATLIETVRSLDKSTQEVLRTILWGRSFPPIDLAMKVRLSEKNSGYQFEIKPCNRNFYLYIDFPRVIADGGYWYSVDLNKYFSEIEC